MKTVYLGIPMFGYDLEFVVPYLRETHEKLIACGYEVESPVEAERYLLGNMSTYGAYEESLGVDSPLGFGKATFLQDRAKIKRSDIVFVDWSYAKEPGVGRVVELAWGFEWKKLNVTVLPKSRKALHHPWLMEMLSGATFETRDAAIDYLNYLKNGEADDGRR